jgi:glycolate oxidase
VLTSPEELLSFSNDATEHSCIPMAVFRPINEEEIVKIVSYAAEKGTPITPRGAGTSLSGCAVPSDGGIVIDLSLMNKIKRVDVENNLVIIEPGVVYADLNRKLFDKGLFFPPDPGSGEVCTVGGMVSTNASGLRAVKYGTTRDYVQKLRVVMATGEVVNLGNLAPKSSSGYDLVGFFVGSEGTLGITTEITLKIINRPTHFAAATLSFESLEDTGRAVGNIIAEGLEPSVLELLDETTLRVVKMFQENDVLGKSVLLIEMDGFSRDDVRERLNSALKICDKAGSKKRKIARSPEERMDLWRARKAALPSLARYKPTLILEDVTVPLSSLPGMLSEVSKIAEKFGLEIATFGHASDNAC